MIFLFLVLFVFCFLPPPFLFLLLICFCIVILFTFGFPFLVRSPRICNCHRRKRKTGFWDMAILFIIIYYSKHAIVRYVLPSVACTANLKRSSPGESRRKLKVAPKGRLVYLLNDTSRATRRVQMISKSKKRNSVFCLFQLVFSPRGLRSRGWLEAYPVHRPSKLEIYQAIRPIMNSIEKLPANPIGDQLRVPPWVEILVARPAHFFTLGV